MNDYIIYIYKFLLLYFVYVIISLIISTYQIEVLRDEMMDDIGKMDNNNLILYKHRVSSVNRFYSKDRTVSSSISFTDCDDKFIKIVNENFDAPNISALEGYKAVFKGLEFYIEIDHSDQYYEFIRKYRIHPSEYANYEGSYFRCHEISHGDIIYLLGYKYDNEFRYVYVSGEYDEMLNDYYRIDEKIIKLICTIVALLLKKYVEIALS